MHRALGPGLLEGIYEVCLCHELRTRGLAFESQAALPVVYKGLMPDAALRIDLLVDESLIVEIKVRREDDY